MAAKRNQERVKSILLLAIPDEYLLKFYNVPDAKSIWAAIKSRFGDEISNKSEIDSEISLSVFEVRSSNEETTSVNDRFSKADGYHDIPPPITRNFLTPRADISFAGLDEYAIKKKIIESKTTEINTDTSKSKTSETIDDEDDVSEVNTVSPVKTNVIQIVKTHVDKIDCDFYAKKSLEPKLKTVDNTGQGWSNQYGTMLKGTGLVNPVRPNRKRAVHTVSTARLVSTARKFAPKIAQTGSAIRPIYPRMDNVRPRASYSPIKRSYYTRPVCRPKDLKQDVKISGVKNMTTAGTRAVVNTGNGKMDNALKKSRWVWRPKGNPESILQDHAVVDSGCSSHMTGNKAYLS
ncbi:hypothetical protein Tco_0993508, partial [Tanacetum coccineum]